MQQFLIDPVAKTVTVAPDYDHDDYTAMNGVIGGPAAVQESRGIGIRTKLFVDPILKREILNLTVEC
jgi:hypothetical protein